MSVASMSFRASSRKEIVSTQENHMPNMSIRSEFPDSAFPKRASLDGDTHATPFHMHFASDHMFINGSNHHRTFVFIRPPSDNFMCGRSSLRARSMHS